MKRSENVGLMLMGGAAFAATFAGGMAYFAWQRPSQAATQAMQSCTPRADAPNSCEPARRSFVHYFYPSSSWSWGWGSSREPAARQQAAFTGSTRGSTPASYTPSSNGGGVERSGFGSSARRSFRISAGG